MLEFNIDKQAGIQLHTCQRKSRWCKFFLLFSWLSMLAFLAWLLWEGFLRLDKQPVPAAPVVQQLSGDCTKEVAASSGESGPECEQQLVLLRKQLNKKQGTESGKKLNAEQGKALSNRLSRQLEDAKLKLKTTQAALLQSREKLKKSKALAADPEAAKKLYFYEKILDVSGTKNAVSINHFAIKPQDKKRHYRFQLLLAKLGNHETITGDYEIFLKGSREFEVKQPEVKPASDKKTGNTPEAKQIKSETVTYKHTGLLPAQSVAPGNAFSFDYYQDLQGDVVLPENFKLETIAVSIKPQGLSSVRNNYEWKNIKKQSFKEVL